jgi:hypothetical protein
VSEAPVMAPDERAFRADLDAEPFLVGVALGSWHLVDPGWPFPVIAVAAAHRSGAPSEFNLRFDLTGYPMNAPTATPWDTTAHAALPTDHRPAGRRPSAVFRRDGWNHGEGLYAPYDRLAMNGHQNWEAEFPHLWWRPEYDITFYLQQVYDILHDEDFIGV